MEPRIANSWAQHYSAISISKIQNGLADTTSNRFMRPWEGVRLQSPTATPNSSNDRVYFQIPLARLLESLSAETKRLRVRLSIGHNFANWLEGSDPTARILRPGRGHRDALRHNPSQNKRQFRPTCFDSNSFYLWCFGVTTVKIAATKIHLNNLKAPSQMPPMPSMPISDEIRKNNCMYVGYRGASQWMSSDNDFFVARRFATLNTRVLLTKQAQIYELNRQLDKLEKPWHDIHSAKAYNIDNSAVVGDHCSERGRILDRLWKALKDYSTKPSLTWQIYSRVLFVADLRIGSLNR